MQIKVSLFWFFLSLTLLSSAASASGNRRCQTVIGLPQRAWDLVVTLRRNLSRNSRTEQLGDFLFDAKADYGTGPEMREAALLRIEDLIAQWSQQNGVNGEVDVQDGIAFFHVDEIEEGSPLIDFKSFADADLMTISFHPDVFDETEVFVDTRGALRIPIGAFRTPQRRLLTLLTCEAMVGPERNMMAQEGVVHFYGAALDGQQTPEILLLHLAKISAHARFMAMLPGVYDLALESGGPVALAAEVRESGKILEARDLLFNAYFDRLGDLKFDSGRDRYTVSLAAPLLSVSAGGVTWTYPTEQTDAWNRRALELEAGNRLRAFRDGILAIGAVNSLAVMKLRAYGRTFGPGGLGVLRVGGARERAEAYEWLFKAEALNY